MNTITAILIHIPNMVASEAASEAATGI